MQMDGYREPNNICVYSRVLFSVNYAYKMQLRLNISEPKLALELHGWPTLQSVIIDIKNQQEQQ